MNFKQYFYLSIFILPFSGLCQNTEYIDGNNVKALLTDVGLYFQDPGATASYEYPKDSSRFVAYAMAYWMGGKDINGQLKLAANTFGSGGSKDYFRGPIADDYNSSHYTSTYASAIWKISRDEINYHVGNYTAVGYTPIPAIANWPGNGNTSEGIAAQLAPYVDVNNDQKPDLILNLHTGAVFPKMLKPFTEIPLTAVFNKLYKRILTAWTIAGLERTNDVEMESDPARVGSYSPFNLDGALSFHCGALCATIESPNHGFASARDEKDNMIVMTPEMLLDAQLIGFRESLKFLNDTGGRSKWTPGKN